MSGQDVVNYRLNGFMKKKQHNDTKNNNNDNYSYFSESCVLGLLVIDRYALPHLIVRTLLG